MNEDRIPCKDCITFSICLNEVKDCFHTHFGNMGTAYNLIPCLIELTDKCSLIDHYLYYHDIEHNYISENVQEMNMILHYYFKYMRSKNE